MQFPLGADPAFTRSISMPTLFRGPGPSKKVKIIKISGGMGGSGGSGGVYGVNGGLGEGPRVRIGVARKVTNINKITQLPRRYPLVIFSMWPAQIDRLNGCTGFRKIPLGDIDLQREIQLDRDSGIGNGAEQEWRRDIKKYMAIRHSNIVQLYGTASFGNIHAAVFHDDLIPLQEFLELYRHSHSSIVYIYTYMNFECRAVSKYFQATFQHALEEVHCTFFIRPSTGRFCMDLVPGGRYLLGNVGPLPGSMPIRQGLEFLAGEDWEATIVDSLTLELYHTMCYWMCYWVPSVMSNTFDDMVEIAWLPNVELGWDAHWNSFGNFGDLMPDGWTRYQSKVIANHIFTTLQISSDFQDYVVVKQIKFTLTIPTVERAMPTGFLFLCPPGDFRTGQSSLKWPECPAYWSLDESGAERLTLEVANSLGFPSFLLSTEIEGWAWDASVYAGLRQFHQGKGFDPDSQDVAQHMGYRLYQCSQVHTPFAHIDEDSPNYDGDNTDDEEFLVDVAAASIHIAVERVLVSHTFDVIVDSIPLDHGPMTASTHQDLEEVSTVEAIDDSTCMDPVDLVSVSTHQDMEEMPLSSTFEVIDVSTCIEPDLAAASAHQHPEDVRLSSTTKFFLNVQLSLIFLWALFWILFEK
ncbi:hypothetical protein MSAN_00312200 [Mycena sanguinolenta]|uniref:Uncharacterized protein n=1 Tax=Mycena sanguinolenta TaxID=230812 RepID=A0A8H7DHA0_9AGAR|nr:hypothetical protein MSAN_00312200 [Mycena sanguinolenta]